MRQAMKRSRWGRRWIAREVTTAPARIVDPSPSVLVVAHYDLTSVEYVCPRGTSCWEITEHGVQRVLTVFAGYRTMIVLDKKTSKVRLVWPTS